MRAQFVKLSASRLATLRQAAATAPLASARVQPVHADQAALRNMSCSAVAPSPASPAHRHPRHALWGTTSAAAAAGVQARQAGTSRLYSAGGVAADGGMPGATSAPTSAPATSAPSRPEADIIDLPAKLALLELEINCSPETALQRFTPFLCSPIHHISTRLAFLASKGKARRMPATPRLFEVICPSDEELCRMHGEQVADLAAFKQQHLASVSWRHFCATHGVQQGQPPQQKFE